MTDNTEAAAQALAELAKGKHLNPWQLFMLWSLSRHKFPPVADVDKVVARAAEILEAQK